MPILLATPQDPTDLVVAGDQMRLAAASDRVDAFWPLIDNPSGDVPQSPLQLIAGSGTQEYLPMQDSATQPDRYWRSQEDGTLIADNALIATPTGALIQVPIGRRLFIRDFIQSTNTFTVSGVTKDSTGVALGNCRVVVMETGRMQTDAVPIVAETVSDGAGNYSVPVPLNTAYQVISYKQGSPDVAGITRNDAVGV